VETDLITLFLFGGSILLWVVIHWFKRARRARTNPYDRFLRDQQVQEIRVEDLRTHNLRMATLGAKTETPQTQATGQQPDIPKASP
jgi:hypothetical protein